VYGLDWQPDRLTFTIDGTVTCELDDPISSTPKFLILNVAVGGFGGGEIDPATLPVEMAIDYVRVTASE
jgi:beta-glucanase (GH16 family)